MRISAIFAKSQNNVIGKNNQLPWHFPADLKHFKNVTMGKPILMGRKTFESIGRALPGRLNIVISRDKNFIAPGCVCVNTIEDALKKVSDQDEIFIIGGAALFQHMLQQIQKLYLTIIYKDFEGDTFFPDINFNHWQLEKREDFQPNQDNPFSYSFEVWNKKTS